MNWNRRYTSPRYAYKLVPLYFMLAWIDVGYRSGKTEAASR